jgi:hypothetical protein
MVQDSYPNYFFEEELRSQELQELQNGVDLRI